MKLNQIDSSEANGCGVYDDAHVSGVSQSNMMTPYTASNYDLSLEEAQVMTRGAGTVSDYWYSSRKFCLSMNASF